MSLDLWFHPLEIESQAALLALFESGTSFRPLSLEDDSPERDAFLQIWPFSHYPVLVDHHWNDLIFGSSVITEYVHVYQSPQSNLLLAQSEWASAVWHWTRMMSGLGRVVSALSRDELKLKHQPTHTEQDQLRGLYLRDALLEKLEQQLSERNWVTGDDFSMADCHAAPIVFSLEAQKMLGDFPSLQRYLDQFWERKAFVRMLGLVNRRLFRYRQLRGAEAAEEGGRPALIDRLRRAKVL